jgi:hypothetical protein
MRIPSEEKEQRMKETTKHSNSNYYPLHFLFLIRTIFIITTMVILKSLPLKVEQLVKDKGESCLLQAQSLAISAHWTVSNFLFVQNNSFHTILTYDDSSLVKWLESCAGTKRSGAYFL